VFAAHLYAFFLVVTFTPSDITLRNAHPRPHLAYYIHISFPPPAPESPSLPRLISLRLINLLCSTGCKKAVESPPRIQGGQRHCYCSHHRPLNMVGKKELIGRKIGIRGKRREQYLMEKGGGINNTTPK